MTDLKRVAWPREEVQRFAVLMERELRNNDHKGGWTHCHVDWLLGRLGEELAELRDAVKAGRPLSEVEAEAADVANFALMVADIYTVWPPRPPEPPR